MKIRLVFTVVMAASLIATGCSSETSEAEGALNDYVEAYNSGDIEAVMALFTEESTIAGHPMSNASGLEAIRRVQVQDLGAAAATDPYSISDVVVSGDTITWNHVWTNSSGSQFCQRGQEAVIEDGKIVTWTWPPPNTGGSKCP